jgi:hypothetical protein
MYQLTIHSMCLEEIFLRDIHAWNGIKDAVTNDPIYLVSSKSIRIEFVVIVHCVGCVCNQSGHVRKCLSISWHKLQVAAFVQLAVVGRGINMCFYVIANFTMCESNEQSICTKFYFNSEKPQRKRINYCSNYTLKMQWVEHKCLTSSVNLKRVETKSSCYLRFLILMVSYKTSISRRQTINKEFYLEVLRRLCESVRRKRTEK